LSAHSGIVSGTRIGGDKARGAQAKHPSRGDRLSLPRGRKAHVVRRAELWGRLVQQRRGRSRITVAACDEDDADLLSRSNGLLDDSAGADRFIVRMRSKQQQVDRGK
jgi:hypothetical protein